MRERRAPPGPTVRTQPAFGHQATGELQPADCGAERAKENSDLRPHFQDSDPMRFVALCWNSDTLVAIVFKALGPRLNETLPTASCPRPEASSGLAAARGLRSE